MTMSSISFNKLYITILIIISALPIKSLSNSQNLSDPLAIATKCIQENPLKSISICKEAISQINETVDFSKNFEAHLIISRAFAQLGDTLSAKNYYNLASQIAIQHSESALHLELAKTRVALFAKCNSSQKVIDIIESTLKSVIDKCTKCEQGEFLLFCADLYKQTISTENAKRYAQTALKIANSCSNIKLQANCNRVLGSLLLKQGDFKQATTFYNLAKLQFESISDTLGILTTLRNISLVNRDLGQFDDAFRNLNSGLQLAISEEFIDERASIFNLLGSLYIRLGKKDEALKYYNLSLAIREQLQFNSSIASTLENISRVQKELKLYDTALKNLLRVITLRKELNDNQLLSSSYNELGNLYSQQGNLADALKYYLNSLKISQEANNMAEAARSLTNIGITYRQLNSNQNAYKYLKQAEELIPDKADPIGKAYILINLGNTLRDLGNFHEALKSYRMALELRILTGNKLIISQAMRSLALAHCDLNEFDESYQNLNKALHIAKDLNDEKIIADIYNEIGNVAFKENNLQDALMHFNNALAIYQKYSIEEKRGLCIRKIGEIQILLGQFENAYKSLNSALSIAHQTKNGKLEELTFLALHNFYKAKDDFKMALNMFNQYISIRDSLNTINQKESFWQASLNLELHEKTEEIKQIEGEVETLRTESKLRIAELEKQKLIGNFIIIISSFILIIAIGSIWGFLVIRQKNHILNITNEKLALSEKELKTIVQTKDKLFNIIAHDLKSPFTALLGLTEILSTQSDGLSTNQVVKYGNLIHEASSKLLNLIENLLHWSSSQTGKISLSPSTISLFTLANEAISILELQAKSKGVAIKNNIPPELTTFADSNTISTVIRNLTSNALKFSNPGGYINIIAKTSGKSILVSIEDNGVGISPSNIEKLFKLEESFSTKGTGQEVGTGLGLIVCKEFVEKNGGEISVKSKLNYGTTFTFTLPFVDKLN
jgi:signal transduction histidine kinase